MTATDPLTIIIVALIGALVTLGTPYLTAKAVSGSRTQDRLDRAAEREQDRLDRLAVAQQVKQVATEVKASNAERSEQLGHIKATGEATHAIVNNQRTVMLRALAVALRTIARDRPDDRDAQKAADDAEHDLAENEKNNADPATKA